MTTKTNVILLGCAIFAPIIAVYAADVAIPAIAAQALEERP